MIEWITTAAGQDATGEFCRRLHSQASILKGEYAVALTGGNSARVYYDALARTGVPARLRFYWSDERLVPPSDPDSNYKLAADHLLLSTGVEDGHVFRPDTSLPPQECAADYAATIRKHVEGGPISTPQFPLIILGLGEDGHTGSLFPGRDPFEDNDLLVRAVEPTTQHPHPRVTFTPKLINNASRVWFVITNCESKKAWAVDQLRKRAASPTQVPALTVDPDQTRVTIFCA
jgi:6-phosphogluconolactonase